MLFNPQQYKLPDVIDQPFIDAEEIRGILGSTEEPTLAEVNSVIAKSMARERLSLRDTAILLNANDPHSVQAIFEGAKKLKQEVYGDRIVIFAPLYVGNKCVNDCGYCGFRVSNREAVRRTLSNDEIRNEVLELESTGQKRLILVYGEHPAFNAAYIARTVDIVYSTQNDTGKINRVNINAAPFGVEGFRMVKEAGIGTYQIFQETYDPAVYEKFHPTGPKSDYNWRLTALDRAMEAGIDDVGLGVLFGLSDWRFEVLSLVRHTNHLEACFNVGPHTISFPRIQNAYNLDRGRLKPISDEDFMKLVAILRLAVPYTGLILTAREPQALRNKLIEYGVSQIDAGTKLEIGGYSEKNETQKLEREQFELCDQRTLSQTSDELVSQGFIPSFCTACYRKGRTGEHFMEFSTKGFIKKFCTPNALLTFAEYLEDYASPKSQKEGWDLIGSKLSSISDIDYREKISGMLNRIRKGERDLLL